MGMFWQYFSFEEKRWNAIFGGGLPGAARHVIASAAWEDPEVEFPDPSEDLEAYLDAVNSRAPEEVVRIANRICSRGISYDDLDREEATLLDSMIVGFFCREGLETLLEYKIEHWNGLHAGVVADLLSRAQRRGGFLGIGARKGFPISLAGIFESGRRIGTAQRPDIDGLYFMLSTREVPLALQEVDGLLAVERPWRLPEYRAFVEEELRRALVRARESGSCLAGRWT